MLNRGVHPVIPSQGSVGASGDLAPLAHLAQVAIGEGDAIYEGRKITGGEAMRSAGIAPLALEAKEGLALLNGTQAMLALLALALREAEIAVDTADVATALSLDALRGSPAAFDARIAKVRPYAGHAINRAQSRAPESRQRNPRIAPLRRSKTRAYRTPTACVARRRCTARCETRSRRFARPLAIELNSATDNPLVFADSGEVISGGNFHGQPLAMAADQLAVALATLAGISERRIEQMTNPQTSQLPAFLVREAGLNSGFMILQVTAAALASEMKALAAPHSVDSIPTSANQEDYVSMGMGAARRLAADARESATTFSPSSCSPPARASIFSRRCAPGSKRERPTTWCARFRSPSMWTARLRRTSKRWRQRSPTRASASSSPDAPLT